MTTDYLIYLIVLSIELVLGLVWIRKIRKPYPIIIPILALILVCEIASRICIVRIQNSNPPYHFYFPIHYLLISVFYYIKSKPNNQFIRYYLYSSNVVGLVITVLNMFFIQSIYVFPSTPILIYSIFIIFLTLNSFSHILEKIEPTPIYKLELFWFNVANLILYSSSFFYWGFFNIMLQNELLSDLIFQAISFATTLAYILYGITLYLATKRNK